MTVLPFGTLGIKQLVFEVPKGNLRQERKVMPVERSSDPRDYEDHIRGYFRHRGSSPLFGVEAPPPLKPAPRPAPLTLPGVKTGNPGGAPPAIGIPNLN